MNNYKQLRKTLFKIIKTLTDSRSLFIENPETDFTRNRILTFDTVLKCVLCFEGGNLNDDLLKQFDYSLDTPTNSALIQLEKRLKLMHLSLYLINSTKKPRKQNYIKDIGFWLSMVAKHQLTIQLMTRKLH